MTKVYKSTVQSDNDNSRKTYSLSLTIKIVYKLAVQYDNYNSLKTCLPSWTMKTVYKSAVQSVGKLTTVHYKF